MADRVLHRLHPLDGALATAQPPQPAPERPRNPFRNEADAFRVLIMFVGATALLVAVTLLTTPLVGALLGAVLVAVGLWRAWGLWQSWRELGSNPSVGEPRREP